MNPCKNVSFVGAIKMAPNSALTESCLCKFASQKSSNDLVNARWGVGHGIV